MRGADWAVLSNDATPLNGLRNFDDNTGRFAVRSAATYTVGAGITTDTLRVTGG